MASDTAPAIHILPLLTSGGFVKAIRSTWRALRVCAFSSDSAQQTHVRKLSGATSRSSSRCTPRAQRRPCLELADPTADRFLDPRSCECRWKARPVNLTTTHSTSTRSSTQTASRFLTRGRRATATVAQLTSLTRFRFFERRRSLACSRMRAAHRRAFGGIGPVVGSAQEVVYEKGGQKVVEDVMSGFNGTIFA